MGEWVGSLAGACEGKRSGVCKWARERERERERDCLLIGTVMVR